LFRKIALAALVAGMLDIMSAFFFAGQAGTSPTGVLHFVASGPFGDQALHGTSWAILGLVVHFSIMALMAAAYMAFAPGFPALYNRPWLAGLLYGLLLWAIMYWIVRPLRWPDMPLPHGLVPISKQLFSHCILVGLPIAYIARMGARRR
jgi:hypothetical protein